MYPLSKQPLIVHTLPDLQLLVMTLTSWFYLAIIHQGDNGHDIYIRPYVFGIGKGVALKHLRSRDYFNAKAEVFNRTDITKGNIIKAGENGPLCMYAKYTGLPIKQLTLQQFCQKV